MAQNNDPHSSQDEKYTTPSTETPPATIITDSTLVAPNDEEPDVDWDFPRSKATRMMMDKDGLSVTEAEKMWPNMAREVGKLKEDPTSWIHDCNIIMKEMEAAAQQKMREYHAMVQLRKEQLDASRQRLQVALDQNAQLLEWAASKNITIPDHIRDAHLEVFEALHPTTQQAPTSFTALTPNHGVNPSGKVRKRRARSPTHSAKIPAGLKAFYASKRANGTVKGVAAIESALQGEGISLEKKEAVTLPDAMLGGTRIISADEASNAARILGTPGRSADEGSNASRILSLRKEQLRKAAQGLEKAEEDHVDPGAGDDFQV